MVTVFEAIKGACDRLESAAECNPDTGCQSREVEFHVCSSTLADGQMPLCQRQAVARLTGTLTKREARRVPKRQEQQGSEAHG